MFDFLSELPTSMQIFWGCALLSTTVFILLTAGTLIGIGGDSADFAGVDADTGMDGGVASEAMQMFSVRNFVNFLMGFGWGGICLERYFESKTALAAVALLVGIGFVFLFLFIYKQMMKLEHSGNINLQRDIVGREADVYLVIRPGERGKVQLSVNGSVREYDAVASDAAAEIPTGGRVRVTGVTGVDTLTVEKI